MGLVPRERLRPGVRSWPPSNGTILIGFGLGHLLHNGRELHAMDQVIGVMLIIIVIGLLTDKILFSPVERFLHNRWGTGLQ